MTISSWIDANGGDAKSIKFVELPQTEAAVAVEAHRVAASLIIHPQVDAALAGGKLHTLGDPYGALAPVYLISGWFAMTDWVKANPDLVKTFVRILDETAVYGNAHHAAGQTARALADFFKTAVTGDSKNDAAVLGAPRYRRRRR